MDGYPESANARLATPDGRIDSDAIEVAHAGKVPPGSAAVKRSVGAESDRKGARICGIPTNLRSI